MTPASFPNGPVRGVEGTAIVLSGDDIDTDRIIPARFLKCITFEGLGEQVFADDRRERAGSHPFDLPGHREARILVVNRNFGCGSSREHAPQALMRWGIRALVGENFAEIFFGNCLAMGIPCLQAPHDRIKALQATVTANPSASFALALDPPLLRSNDGQTWPLELGAGPRQMLLSGQWDATSQLVSHDRELKEAAAKLPYLSGFING
jgi:3-isopropylmalate/(R)-2-methylmalate dehydratase small subunit